MRFDDSLTKQINGTRAGHKGDKVNECVQRVTLSSASVSFPSDKNTYCSCQKSASQGKKLGVKRINIVRRTVWSLTVDVIGNKMSYVTKDK